MMYIDATGDLVRKIRLAAKLNLAVQWSGEAAGELANTIEMLAQEADHYRYYTLSARLCRFGQWVGITFTAFRHGNW